MISVAVDGPKHQRADGFGLDIDTASPYTQTSLDISYHGLLITFVLQVGLVLSKNTCGV